MVDFNLYNIYFHYEDESDKHKAVHIKVKQSDYVSNLYYTDGQISALLQINTNKYREILNKQFDCKLNDRKDKTLIPNKTSVEEIRDFFESILLMNSISKHSPREHYRRFI